MESLDSQRKCKYSLVLAFPYPVQRKSFITFHTPKAYTSTTDFLMQTRDQRDISGTVFALREMSRVNCNSRRLNFCAALIYCAQSSSSIW